MRKSVLRLHNPKGIVAISPELSRRSRGYPGWAIQYNSQPQRGCVVPVRFVCFNPFRVGPIWSPFFGPRCASARHTQPGAEGWNPIGI
jgi:hypothetical protein